MHRNPTRQTRYRSSRPPPFPYHPDNVLYSSGSKAFLDTLRPFIRRMKLFIRRISLLHRIAGVIIFLSMAFSIFLKAAMSPSSSSSHTHLYKYSPYFTSNSHAASRHTKGRDFNHGIAFGSLNEELTEEHTSFKRRSYYHRVRNVYPNRIYRGTRQLPSTNPSSRQMPSVSIHTKQYESEGKSPRKRGRYNLLDGETSLTSLPSTEWLFEKQFARFLPLRRRSTDIRLISLRNACFCTQRNKFLFPRLGKSMKKRVPGFFFRYGAAQTIPWKNPKALLASSKQKTVHISGTTIFWRGRSLNSNHAHLSRSLVPIRSLIDIVKKTKFGNNLKVAAEAFTAEGKSDETVLKLQNYYIGDILQDNRIEVSRLRPLLVCFENVLSIGTEYEGHASSVESYGKVKDLIKKEEQGTLKESLVKKCDEKSANKHTIWVMDKQQEHSNGGSISNIPNVQVAIDHELMKVGLAENVQLKIIQAPKLRCARGTAKEGCFDTTCSGGTDGTECQQSENVLQQVKAFNNMTFLITTSGPANEGFVYMPTGSQVIEIAPTGILDHSHELAAKDAMVNHYMMENGDDKAFEQSLFERFGDVAKRHAACWDDFECRRARLGHSTTVDVHHLRLLLRRGLSVWKKRCLVGRK